MFDRARKPIKLCAQHRRHSFDTIKCGRILTDATMQTSLHSATSVQKQILVISSTAYIYACVSQCKAVVTAQWRSAH